MNTIRNSYFITRVMVWLQAGDIPTVTLASATVRVNELAYRTAPGQYESIARHYSKTVDLETFPVDREMLDRIRLSMTRVFAAACIESDASSTRNHIHSNWFFQPQDDGWFAMYDGKPKDLLAFRRWLADVLD
jgi:hypothetical protein